MSKKEWLDACLLEKHGVLRTADVVKNGISKQYFSEYVQAAGLHRVSRGVYLSPDAWRDECYLLQARFPAATFSHETALYLLDMADREPLQLTVTVRSGYHYSSLTDAGIKVYSIKKELYGAGQIEVVSNFGHILNTYNSERTICDMLRSRSHVEQQDLQTALKSYVQRKDKNLPQLLRYARDFHVETLLRQYLEVLLP
ncbi:MAG: type IV toxin-antitoxin system AbiEi family antitoxin domain-containing protein [Pseudoflavonifractor sp.]